MVVFRMAVGVLAVLASLPAMSVALHAQTVRGVVLDERSALPVTGAVVALLDENGDRRAAVFSDSLGAFTIRATRAGSFRLWVERITYQPRLTPAVQLAAGSDHEVTVRLAPRTQAMRTVTVIGHRSCKLTPEQSSAVSGMWDDVRAALSATVLTEQEQKLRIRYTTYERDLDTELTELGRTSRESVVQGGMVFSAVPIEQLERHGYVQQERGEMVYNAPDAHVLLSDHFLDNHCFRPADARVAGDSLIGLYFEPARTQRNYVDVRGILWLNATTRELSSLQYEYVGPQFNRRTGEAGGRLDFRELPSGRWIVDRWYIRMPVRGSRLVGYKEAGGEVLEVRAGEARRLLP
jgi:hypothetical protein